MPTNPKRLLSVSDSLVPSGISTEPSLKSTTSKRLIEDKLLGLTPIALRLDEFPRLTPQEKRAAEKLPSIHPNANPCGSQAG